MRGSFVPPKPQRRLRTLTRYRKTQIAERQREANRLHKALEDTGIKLDCVATDILGASGRAMLDALVAGHHRPARARRARQGQAARQAPRAARGARGPLRGPSRARDRRDPRAPGLPRRADRPALRGDRGRAGPYRRRASSWRPRSPASPRRTAEVMVAEIGTDMRVFPTAGHLAPGPAAAPATTSPPANAAPDAPAKAPSGSGSRSKRPRWPRPAPSGSYLAGPIPAPRHASATAARSAPSNTRCSIAYWHMFTTGETYHDLGGDYFQRRDPERHTKRLVAKLEALGHHVTLQPAAALIPAAFPIRPRRTAAARRSSG